MRTEDGATDHHVGTDANAAMFFLVLVLVLVSIGVPLAYAWRIVRLREPSLAGWLIVVAEATAFVSLVLIVGRWDIAGYYTRFIVLAVFVAAVVRSLRTHASLPWRPAEGRSVMRSHATSIGSLVLFVALLAHVISANTPAEAPHRFAFPLEDGRFMIGQGGSTRILNHHAGHREQRYAVDISAIGDLGFRAAGILPKELERYAIYGATVVSPCAGRVVAAQDGLRDLVPPESERENPAGNHVVIDCGDVDVELAHLKAGSVAVSAGERVVVGQMLGAVGNSGNTTEPHLHMHAVDSVNRSGVPIVFDGGTPARNRLYVE